MNRAESPIVRQPFEPDPGDSGVGMDVLSPNAHFPGLLTPY